MDPIVQAVLVTASVSVAIAVITGTVGIIKNIVQNKKTFQKFNDNFNDKVGEIGSGSLSKQHERIEHRIDDRSRLINTEIGKLDKGIGKVEYRLIEIGNMLVRNDERYSNLNIDQKQISDNISGLLSSWEAHIQENKILKERIGKLERENEKLKDMIRDRRSRVDDWEMDR